VLDDDGDGPRGRWVGAAMSVGRGALVALPIAAGFVLLAVFPFRTWLDQQDAIADTRDRLARLQAENERLEADSARLASPTEIERRARAQFNLVYPGEEAIAIIAPEPTAPPPTAAPDTAAGVGPTDTGAPTAPTTTVP
jgi:cell division protein FtsB